MGVRDICLRDTLRKILLNLQRGIGSVRDKSQTMGYTVDMRVDGKGRLSIPHTLQDIGRFPPHPGQRCQFFRCGRNLTTKVGDQFPRHLYQVPRLGIGIADGMDIFKYVLRFRSRHCLCVRIVPEEFRCHLVDSLVSTLCGKKSRTKQLEWRGKVQLRSLMSLILLKIIENIFVSFLSCHSGCKDSYFQRKKRTDNKKRAAKKQPYIIMFL